MDAFGIHSCNRGEKLQLGSDNLKTIKNLCTIVLDSEGRRGTNFLHGLVPVRCHVCMNLRWHVAGLPVHIYFSVLWENKYKKYYKLICDEFINYIYFIIFEKEFPRLSSTTKKMIAKVGHWYLDEHSTYIEVFVTTRAPHLLPAHVPDRLVVGEICYQTILQGYNATLVKDKT
jgi:hypothetical protein